MHIKPEMTVAVLFDINPMSAQVLFRCGVRSLLSPFVVDETIEHLSQQYQFDLAEAIKELERLVPKTSDLLVEI